MKLSFNMKFLVVSLVALLSSASSQKPFSFNDCGGNESIVKILDLDLSPYPVAIGKGQDLRATFSIDVTKPMDSEANLSLKIRRSVKVLWTSVNIPVPCIRGMGSCTRNFCEFFEDLRPILCPIIEAGGKECKCPLAVNHYKGSGIPILIEIPSFFPKVLQSIGSGNYNVEGKITSSSGETLGCFNVDTGVKIET